MRQSFAAALMMSVSLFAASASPAQVGNDADTLALAGFIDNNSFDRAELMIGNQIQYWQPVFETLLTALPDNSLEPNLATSWSYNEDNTELTLVLREGVNFTDGTLFDAEAVKANLQYLATGNGTNSYMARTIADFEIVSDHEIRLHLGEPDPALLNNLAIVGGAMASPATLGEQGSETRPIGTGPYLYDASASVPESQYVYERNPDYWNAEAYPFERITITPIVDAAARLNALLAGQVDAAMADQRAISQAEASGITVNAVDVNWAGIILADRDGTIAPPLADVRVRQALNMAFDEAAMLEFIDLGYGRLSDQIFPEWSEAYLPELDDYYPYDPEAARALLEEAGYEDGFRLVLPNILPFAAFYPIVEQQLAEIGIEAVFEGLPPGSAIPIIRSGQYPAYVFTFAGHDAWTDIQQHLTEDAGWNAFRHSDPELNELIDRAQFATGEEQIEAFQDINRYIVENAFFVPWYRRDSIYLTGPQIEVDMQASNAAPFIRSFRHAQ